MSSVPRLPSAIPGQAPMLRTVLAHAPATLREFNALYGSFWSHGRVDQVVKETVRLRNARITDCGY